MVSRARFLHIEIHIKISDFFLCVYGFGEIWLMCPILTNDMCFLTGIGPLSKTDKVRFSSVSHLMLLQGRKQRVKCFWFNFEFWLCLICSMIWSWWIYDIHVDCIIMRWLYILLYVYMIYVCSSYGDCIWYDFWNTVRFGEIWLLYPIFANDMCFLTVIESMNKTDSKAITDSSVRRLTPFSTWK